MPLLYPLKCVAFLKQNFFVHNQRNIWWLIQTLQGECPIAKSYDVQEVIIFSMMGNPYGGLKTRYSHFGIKVTLGEYFDVSWVSWRGQRPASVNCQGQSLTFYTKGIYCVQSERHLLLIDIIWCLRYVPIICYPSFHQFNIFLEYLLHFTFLFQTITLCQPPYKSGTSSHRVQ